MRRLGGSKLFDCFAFSCRLLDGGVKFRIVAFLNAVFGMLVPMEVASALWHCIAVLAA